jgi:hypothetical protein
VRINEELLERKVAAPVYKTEINDRRGSAALHATLLYPQKLALNFVRSIGIVRLWTKGHGVCFLFFCDVLGLTNGRLARVALQVRTTVPSCPYKRAPVQPHKPLEINAS